MVGPHDGFLRDLKAARANFGHNRRCFVCGGDGFIEVADADICANTPRDVAQAVSDARPFAARIECPNCTGSGLVNR